MRSIDYVHSHNINPVKRIIYLVNYPGVNDENDGVDFRQAQNFIKNMDLLESKSNDPITIQMYSTGGDWFAGIAIFDRIISSGCRVTMVAHAHATSMSGIILQAAHERIIMPNAHFMLHYGSEGMAADYLSVLNYTEYAKNHIGESMFDIYASRCVDGEFFKGKTLKQTKVFLKKKLKSGDWYLSPTQALKYGFIDKVFDGRKH
jgi:ATP-dependent protease ClpP protease subunit